MSWMRGTEIGVFRVSSGGATVYLRGIATTAVPLRSQSRILRLALIAEAVM